MAEMVTTLRNILGALAAILLAGALVATDVKLLWVAAVVVALAWLSTIWTQRLQKLADSEKRPAGTRAGVSRWPIHDLLAYLRPDLPSNAGDAWSQTLLKVADEFAAAPSFTVWGRKWRGMQDSSLEIILPDAWSELYLHPWAADPAWQRGRHAQRRAHSAAPWEYANIQVDRAQALEIWPQEGCLMPKWLSMPAVVNYVRNYTEWRTETLGEGWALDFDRDLRAAFGAPDGPATTGREYGLSVDTSEYQPPERKEILRAFWADARFEQKAMMSWGGSFRLTAYNEATQTKFDNIEIEYAGLMRAFPRVSLPPAPPVDQMARHE